VVVKYLETHDEMEDDKQVFELRIMSVIILASEIFFYKKILSSLSPQTISE